MNWTANLVISMTFLSLINAITAMGAFFLYVCQGGGVMRLIAVRYAGICVLAWLFVLFVQPETKGKSLEEIQAALMGKKVNDIHK